MSLSEVRAEWKLLTLLALVLSAPGCGGGRGEEASSAGSSPASGRPSGRGACALLLQGEVDELFGKPAGAGAHEDLGEGIEICTWPAEGEPRLLLQAGPSGPDVRAAVDLGEGYRVDELSGMAGPAAFAVIEPEAEQPASVAVLAVDAAGKTLVVSPIGLAVTEGSARFERLKAIVDEAASRLGNSGAATASTSPGH